MISMFVSVNDFHLLLVIDFRRYHIKGTKVLIDFSFYGKYLLNK